MATLTPQNKYQRIIVGIADQKDDGQLGAVIVDVYRVLDAYKVSCPALAHLIKKALCVGLRGHKDTEQDLQDIIDSAVEAQRLHAERKWLSCQRVAVEAPQLPEIDWEKAPTGATDHISIHGTGQVFWWNQKERAVHGRGAWWAVCGADNAADFAETAADGRDYTIAGRPGLK